MMGSNRDGYRTTLMTSGRSIGVPRRVLVIGGGFLGTHLTRGFVCRGATTTLLTRRPLRGSAATRVTGASLVIGDAAHEDALQEALADAEHVVWAAGGLMPAESNERPVDDVVATLSPLLRLLDALVARGGTASVSFLSSGGTVYGDPTVLPVPEHHLPQPLSSHGVSKVACEMYLSM